MITHLTQDGWDVIYHRAHALLAAQLAGHWRKSDAPERLYETIAAISHHDDLEREWEGDHITEAGAPLDFTLQDVEDGAIEKLCEQVNSARYRGRWVTLLTSKHLTVLNKSLRGKSKEWDKFLNEQEKLQAECLKGLDVTPEEVERAYQFMHWCDRLSLILAQQEVPEAGRALEITSGIDGQRYDIRALEDGRVTVEPWPFEDKEFTVNVEAIHLSELKFKSNEALIAALQAAPVKTLTWTFVKQ